MSISVSNISKSFGSFRALDNVSVNFPSGQLVALLGPSGSGKTTLLRIVAGLEIPDDGVVHFEGKDATDYSARDRRVGFVFQHYALFRHMSVFENVAFGLRVKPRKIRPNEIQIRQRVKELLELVQLESLANRFPSQLSGGQRQRIALARALAVEPKVLLLDEPFGALDAKVRKELRRWLRRLHDEIHLTSIFVTHDVEEALDVSDEIVVMNNGRIEQIGSPQEVYDHPINPFVFDFLGGANRLDNSSQKELIYARPHDIELSREQINNSNIPTTVIAIHSAGPRVRVELLRKDSGETLEAELSREGYQTLQLVAGEHIYAHPRDQKVYNPDYSI